MSRIGKRPVEAPSGVEFKVSGQTIEAKGPKGTRSFTATDDVDIIGRGERARSLGTLGLDRLARDLELHAARRFDGTFSDT